MCKLLPTWTKRVLTILCLASSKARFSSSKRCLASSSACRLWFSCLCLSSSSNVTFSLPGDRGSWVSLFSFSPCVRKMKQLYLKGINIYYIGIFWLLVYLDKWKALGFLKELVLFLIFWLHFFIVCLSSFCCLLSCVLRDYFCLPRCPGAFYRHYCN